MKVILSESYMSLGEAGDVVDVRPGYGRNFLIPQKIAVSATGANLRRFQDKQKELTAKKERERENSKKTLTALQSVKLVIKKSMSDEGKLFGSVTTKDLEAEFAQKQIIIDRRQIVLGQQIKMAGEYKIMVKLVGGMKAMVPIEIESDDPKKAATMKALKEETRLLTEQKATEKIAVAATEPAQENTEAVEAVEAAASEEAPKKKKKPKTKAEDSSTEEA
jgi:large subunit ribosomal protein L9